MVARVEHDSGLLPAIAPLPQDPPEELFIHDTASRRPKEEEDRGIPEVSALAEHEDRRECTNRILVPIVVVGVEAPEELSSLGVAVSTRHRCGSGVFPNHSRELFREGDGRAGGDNRQVTDAVLVRRVETVHHAHDETPVVRHVLGERNRIVVVAAGTVHDGHIIERDGREIDLTPRERCEDAALDAVAEASAVETRTEVRVCTTFGVDVERRAVVERHGFETLPGSRREPVGGCRVAQHDRFGKALERFELRIGVGPVHLVTDDKMRVEPFRELCSPGTQAVLRCDHDRLVLPALRGVHDGIVFVIANLDREARDMTDRDAATGKTVDLTRDLVDQGLV